MTRKLLTRMVVSSFAMALLVVGCKPGEGAHVARASSRAPSAEKAAAQYSQMADTAMRRRNGPLAVALAERAVATRPQEARYRAQLSQAYLLAGRFGSAVASFRETVTLAPDDGRSLVSMALAQAALGREGSARATLDLARGKVGEGDRGLALALAGNAEGAVTVLEHAARERDASARTRQNLAFAYALAGRWDVARATAAQDVSPADLDARMTQWAALAQPRAVASAVSAFLGVTPVRDAGMPTELALAPVEPVMLAMNAEPVPVTIHLPAPELARADPAPAFVEATPAFKAPAMRVRPTRRAAPMLARASYVQHPQGRWAVQLGAYSTQRAVATAWTRVSGRMQPIAGLAPSSSTIRIGGAVFHRLSVSGFADRAQAVNLCERVRRMGAPCFVRARTGSAPIQWAAARAPVRLVVR